MNTHVDKNYIHNNNNNNKAPFAFLKMPVCRLKEGEYNFENKDLLLTSDSFFDMKLGTSPISL